MGIVTKTGDDGSTSLFSGERVSKNDIRVEVLGAVDELSCLLGFAACAAGRSETATSLRSLQEILFRVGGELSSAGRAFGGALRSEDLGELDRAIESLEPRYVPEGFILPGKNESSARIHLARTAARRLERRVVSMADVHAVSDTMRRWLNRLSDYLFLLARAEEDID
jgi:ATP:cob(I)alamin adenosyltransferase